MRTYIAAMNIDHDGVRYAPGSPIVVDEEAAERLLKAGAVEAPAAVVEVPEQEVKSDGAGSTRRSRKGAP